jgi:uncharacterized membrane protein
MELLFAIVLITGVVLFVRVGRLGAQVADALERLRLAEQDVRDLRRLTENLRPPDRISRKPRQPRAAASVAVATSVAVASPATPATPAPAVAGRSIETGPAPATPDELAGPGIVARLLETLGMAAAEGEAGVSRAAVQAWLEGRLLAVVGGIALVLGAAFFLSLAFSRGWITEPLRVLMGLGAGAGLLALGELALVRLRGIVGHVLVAVGLAITSLALLASSRLYGLVPAEWALAGSFLAATTAAVIALRHGSQVIAGFGLVTVLAAPPVMGADASLPTLGFVAAALAGTTAIALHRTWSWLPPLAFALVAPQLAAHLTGDAPALERMAALAAFWFVNVVAAGGEEARRPSDRLRRTTVSLLLVNAAYALWAGLAILDGDLMDLRGAFVGMLGLGHLALGLAFLYRLGDRQPFGQVVAATGVAAITMAVPIQFEGPAVPVAWAGEAVVLAWVAWKRRHAASAYAAGVLGALALGHLVVVEYPFTNPFGAFGAPPLPFASPGGVTAAFLGIALLAVGWIVRSTWLRALLGAAGAVVASYVAAFELGGPPLVAAWSAIALAAVLADGRISLPRRPGPEQPGRRSIGASAATFLRDLAPDALPVAAGVAATGAIVHLLAFDFPILRLGRIISEPPFVGWETAALAAVVLALAVAARLDARRHVRLGAAGIALIVLVYAVTFELPRPAVMITWAALGVVGLAIPRRLVPAAADRPRERGWIRVGDLLPHAAAVVAGAFLLVQANWYAPASDWLAVTIGRGAAPAIPFLDDRSLAFAILAITAVVAGDVWRSPESRLVGVAAAAGAVTWLLPFELARSWTVAGWSVIGFGGSVLLARGVDRRRPLLAGIGILVAHAALAAFTVAPPSKLWIAPVPLFADSPALLDSIVAVGSLGALALGSGLVRGPSTTRTRLLVTAACVMLYLASIGLVHQFQAQVGTRLVDDLAKEAQVALSVLWSVVGGVAFAAGLRLRRPTTRVFGLAVLGLATAKVFLFDLASLDVAYRVLSLVALGVLLLGSALVYARLQRDAPVEDRGVAAENAGTS